MGKVLSELCNLVLDHADAVSIIRFPVVCRDWATATKTTWLAHLTSGAPTLLTSSLDPEGCDIEYDNDKGTFGLHNVGTGKSYYGESDGMKNRTWVGGKDDWLVTTAATCSLDLLNLITGVRIPLPSFATIPGVDLVHVRYRNPGVFVLKRSSAVEAYFQPLSHRLQRVTLCRTPVHRRGYMAVAIFSYRDSPGLIALTAVGDKQWTSLKNPLGLHYLNKYMDVSVHQGKVVAVACSGNIIC